MYLTLVRKEAEHPYQSFNHSFIKGPALETR
ncbi:hypothetical protein C361_04809 [Cryptococcus neoformans Tu259-1]|uniref:Uncharacterized protein n=1 Tax=Cryptococcus neoformans Tu259-1 TaxID=1230072 RepID=A0A854Q857_CRYNE|nr:hypothetical protein C361_04809 [Cryptococcus neoformans var. grubii Tu259-1]